MPSSARASASIIVAATVAILGSALGFLSTLFMFILFSSSHFSEGAPFPPPVRTYMYAIWTFSMLCMLFVGIVGVQVISLRNWARISLLIISGCLLFFGAVGIVIIFVTIFVSPYSDPSVPKALLATILAVTYGIPIVISVWWLILFTRRSVVAQFQAREQFSISEFSQSVAQSPPQLSPIILPSLPFTNP